MKFRSWQWSNRNVQFARTTALLQRSLIVSLALTLLAASSNAAPAVYVVTASQQFGTVDLATGKFHPIGNPGPEPMSNLVWGPDGSLLTLFTLSGSLAKINPATGAMAVIGPTGLGLDAFDLAGVGGKLYLTDFQNNIYSVDPETGAAMLIGATGMPPDPTIPFTTNKDGTFNLCDESLYGVAGKLYATFDSYAFYPKPGPNFLAITTKVNPKLYQIDPATGVATAIGASDLQLGASVAAGTKFYAFRLALAGFSDGFPLAYSELVALDLKSGRVSFVRTIDPAAGPIFGAAPTQR
jgi:hypothetical protein